MKNNLSPEQFTTALHGMEACDEALEWAHGRDYNTAWNTCGNPDWMFFFINKAAPLTSLVNELLVCRFAREVVYLTDDPRVLACIEVREAWARGKATDEERSAARGAVGDAAWGAAWNAATGIAAWADAESNSQSVSRGALRDTAWNAMLAKQCAIVRELIAQPELV